MMLPILFLHHVSKLNQTVVMIISPSYCALAFYVCGRPDPIESQDWDIYHYFEELAIGSKGVRNYRQKVQDRSRLFFLHAYMNASEFRYILQKSLSKFCHEWLRISRCIYMLPNSLDIDPSPCSFTISKP